MASDDHVPSPEFSWRTLVVLVVIGLTVVGSLFYSIQRIRLAAARTETINNLKQITLACHSCNDVYKKLPPACGIFGPADFPITVHVYLHPFTESDPFYKDFLETRGQGVI